MKALRAARPAAPAPALRPTCPRLSLSTTGFALLPSPRPVQPSAVPKRAFASCPACLRRAESPGWISKSPFEHYHRLLSVPNTSMAELLEAVPSKLFTESSAGGGAKKWPRRILLDLLSRPADFVSIVRLTPYIEQDVRLSSINRATWTIAALLAAVARINAQALVPAVVDIFLARLSVATEDPLDETKLDNVFFAILDSLKAFAKRSSFPEDQLSRTERYRQRLPPAVNAEVMRLVRAYLTELDEGPSSSKGRQMGVRTLDLLFSPRFLTPPLRELLVDHCQSRGVRMKPWWWKRCMASAAAEGNVEQAQRYYEELVQTDKEADQGDLDTQVEVPGEEDEDRLDNEDVRTLMLLSARRPTHEVLTDLQSYLAPDTTGLGRNANSEDVDDSATTTLDPVGSSTQTKDGTAQYAWSILLDKLAHDPRIDANTILRLTGSMPSGLVTAPSVTPAMQGLLNRHEPAQAWDLWTRYMQPHHDGPQPDLDGALLSVAAEADFQLRGLDSSVAFVDRHARRPQAGPPNPNSDNSLNHPEIVIDVHVLNRLLYQCLLSHRPSVAFRLFHAALPRWGVWPDEISLALLIDVARYAPSPDESRGEDVLQDRLRDMADAFSFRRLGKALSDEEPDGDQGSYDAYDAAGFAKGGANVLLDPPGYTWRAENVRIRPWEKARRVFRQVMLGNWPHLADIHSPLDVGGAFASITDFFMHRDAKLPLELGEPGATATPHGPTSLPRASARYPHIVPSARAFHSYVCMLGFYALHEEIPAVLAWMRDRGIVPRWETMLMALMHVCENEGPRRPVGGRLMRDEEILRAWLEDWLGTMPDPSGGSASEKAGADGEFRRAWGPERDLFLGLGKERTGRVPSEDQVARWIRHIRSRRESITA